MFKIFGFILCLSVFRSNCFERPLLVPACTPCLSISGLHLGRMEKLQKNQAMFRRPQSHKLRVILNSNANDIAEMDGIRIVKSASNADRNAKKIETLNQDPVSNASENFQFDAKLLLEFERNGHIAVPKLFSHCPDLSITLGDIQRSFDDELNTNLKQAYKQKMRLFAEDDDDEELLEASKNCKTAAEAKSILDAWCKENDCPIPFLQLFNMHRGQSPAARAIHALAASPSMGRIAADLLGSDGVRLYQTSAFFKVSTARSPNQEKRPICVSAGA